MHAYQAAIKDARMAFMAKLVADHHHNPGVIEHLSKKGTDSSYWM